VNPTASMIQLARQLASRRNLNDPPAELVRELAPLCRRLGLRRDQRHAVYRHALWTQRRHRVLAGYLANGGSLHAALRQAVR